MGEIGTCTHIFRMFHHYVRANIITYSELCNTPAELYNAHTTGSA